MGVVDLGFSQLTCTLICEEQHAAGTAHSYFKRPAYVGQSAIRVGLSIHCMLFTIVVVE